MRNKILSTSLTCFFVILCGLQLPVQAQISHDEATRASGKIVTNAAINALPIPLRSFYQDRIEKIHTIVNLWSSLDPDKPRGEPDFHYIHLDIAASSEDWENRLGAVQRFPHDRKQAKLLFDKLGVNNNGQLPWVILDKQQSLEQAFNNGESVSILYETGMLLHFIADASWLKNTTTHHVIFSHRTSNSSTVHDPPKNVKSFSTLPINIPLTLTPQLLDRLAYEVRVSMRYQRISDPTQAVFHELIQTYKTIHLLQEAAKSTRYEDKLAMIFEERFEAVALLGANLIGSAWENANKPSLIVTEADPHKTISKKNK